jgi:hypothetical protein
VLEGSVRKAGNTIRVTAQLIRADNGYHLWSQTYDRDLKDVFKVQDEIAGRVVEELKVALPSDRVQQRCRTENAAAYNRTCWAGNTWINPRPRARQRDRVFQSRDRARSGLRGRLLAPVHRRGESGGSDRRCERLQARRCGGRARDHARARQRRRLQRARPSALHFPVGLGRGERRFQQSPRHRSQQLRHAAQLQPHARLPKGSWREALAAIDKAIQIDPLVATFYSLRGRVLTELGRSCRRARRLSAVAQLNPAHPHANVDLAIIDLLDGRPEQALAALQQPAAPGWRLLGTALSSTHWVITSSRSRRSIS